MKCLGQHLAYSVILMLPFIIILYMRKLRPRTIICQDWNSYWTSGREYKKIGAPFPFAFRKLVEECSKIASCWHWRQSMGEFWVTMQSPALPLLRCLISPAWERVHIPSVVCFFRVELLRNLVLSSGIRAAPGFPCGLSQIGTATSLSTCPFLH